MKGMDAVCPLGAATMRLVLQGAAGGMLKTMELGVTEVGLTAVVPTETVTPGANPLPLIVMGTPPAAA